ncbi:MAG: hypothetical protein Kow0063_42290 [Anaerolineae bacterium]
MHQLFIIWLREMLSNLWGKVHSFVKNGKGLVICTENPKGVTDQLSRRLFTNRM